MKRARVWVILVAGTLALASFVPELSGPRDSIPPPPSPPSPTTAKTVLTPGTVYDTIRTDLTDYQWPTDAGRLITSTFGEYRRTHFHGGIDISTGDVTGFRVFAARAGDVARVRVDPSGYGKILYLRHPDGYTTTYAHLRNFAPGLEMRVRAEQERLERYPVNIQFAAGELPVRKGELVAYTGDTGSGSPHLHFEIRDEHMNGVNPMLAPAFRTRDDIPPAFRKIAFVPLTPGSSVNDDPQPLAIRVRMINPRSFAIPAPVAVEGAAGIGVFVRDRGNGTRYSRGVYLHRLIIDGRPFFEVRFDRVPMEESQQIGLYYERDLLRMGAGRFEKLYVDAGNDLPFVGNPHTGSGWLSPESLPAGRHTFTVVSQDFSGNTSHCDGTIIIAARPPVITAGSVNGNIVITTSMPGHTSRVSVEAKEDPRSRWSALAGRIQWDSAGTSGRFPLPAVLPSLIRVRAESDNSSWSRPAYVVLRSGNKIPPAVRLTTELIPSGIRADISTDGDIGGSPSLAVEEGTIRRLFPMLPADEHHYWTAFAPLDSVPGTRTLVFEGNINTLPVRVVEKVDVYPILPGRKGSITADNGNFRLDYDSLSVYDTLYLQVKVVDSEESRIYELLPDGAVLRDGFAVTLRTDKPGTGDAVYRRDGAEWSLLGFRAGSDGDSHTPRLTGRLNSLTVLSDSVPPAIGNFRCAWRGKNRPIATFRVWDRLSGVDYKTLKAYLDGKFVVPEIDGEHRRATITAPEGLTRGPHHLQVRVQDKMGNPTLIERGFVVP